jgi:hypothetical protein
MQSNQLLMAIFLWLTTNVFAAPSNNISNIYVQLSEVGCDVERLHHLLHTNTQNISARHLVLRSLSQCQTTALKLAGKASIPHFAPQSQGVTALKLKSLELSANKVDVTNGRQTINVTMTIYDAESEIDYAYIALSPPSGISSSHNIYAWFGTSSSQPWIAGSEAHTYTSSATLNFDKGDSAGEWTISSVYIRNKSGRADVEYSNSAALISLGIDPYIEVTLMRWI